MGLRNIGTAFAAVLLSAALSPAALAQDTCTVQLQIEDAGGGNATVNAQSTEIEVPKTGAFSETGTIASVTWGVNNTLLYVRDRDCAIPDMNVKVAVGGTDYDVNFDGTFGSTGAGNMICGGPFEWQTGAEGWAGCFPSAGNPLGGVTDYSGGATVTISRTDAGPAVPEACEVGVHYEEAFGGAVYNATDCANPYYEHPAGKEVWAGFADKITPEGLLPYSFPYGAKLTFTCAGDAAQRVRFRFEPEAGVQSPFVESHASGEGYTCDGTPQTWDVPAGTQTWGNPLMYVKQSAPAVLVKDITITANTEAPDTGDDDNDTTPTPSVPVPAMPLGGLLGLIALVGWLGLRRRG